MLKTLTAALVAAGLAIAPIASTAEAAQPGDEDRHRHDQDRQAEGPQAPLRDAITSASRP